MLKQLLCFKKDLVGNFGSLSKNFLKPNFNELECIEFSEEFALDSRTKKEIELIKLYAKVCGVSLSLAILEIDSLVVQSVKSWVDIELSIDSLNEFLESFIENNEHLANTECDEYSEREDLRMYSILGLLATFSSSQKNIIDNTLFKEELDCHIEESLNARAEIKAKYQ